MIKVLNTIRLLEIEGKTVPVGGPNILIESHWNDNHLVTLVIDAKRYTCVADDLSVAIGNATNINRF